MKKINLVFCSPVTFNKMASLVADYGDSSGDSDEEQDSEYVCAIQEGAEQTEETSVNFFAENRDDSSDDSNGCCTEENSIKEKQEEDSVSKLPNPFLDTKLPSPHLNSAKKKKKTSSFIPVSTSSVFVNPFEQAEQAKLGILEKHVRLTEAAPQKPATKQVCFKFKKGKCFLGDKCRFFHDRSNMALGSGSDKLGDVTIQDMEQDLGPGFGRGDSSFKFPGLGGTSGRSPEGQFYHPVAHFSQGQPADPRTIDDDNYMAAAKGKKRHGVTDSLVPPKKALIELGDLRKHERPWTMKK